MTSQVVAEALGAIKEHLTMQDRLLARIEADGKETKVQATKTNSRVTQLEIHKERQEAVAADRHQRNWRRTTAWTGLGGGCGALLGYVGHAAGLW